MLMLVMLVVHHALGHALTVGARARAHAARQMQIDADSHERRGNHNCRDLIVEHGNANGWPINGRARVCSRARRSDVA